jgi:hypothetical protein
MVGPEFDKSFKEFSGRSRDNRTAIELFLHGSAELNSLALFFAMMTDRTGPESTDELSPMQDYSWSLGTRSPARSLISAINGSLQTQP